METEEKYSIYGDKHELTSLFGYLIGIRKSIFENDKEPLLLSVYEKAEQDKRARILRNLCVMRGMLMRHFKAIRLKMGQGEPTTRIDEFPGEAMDALQEDGITVFNPRFRGPGEYIMAVNQYIVERVDACQPLFPDWIEWKYIKNMIVMPDGTRQAGSIAASDLYYKQMRYYPYQQYINWNPADEGNILYTDLKFVKILYEQNKDSFDDRSKVSDATGETKESIRNFISEGAKTVIIIDCENVDPYRFSATLKAIDEETAKKINKIILIDDVNASLAWRYFENRTSIEVTHIMIERVLSNKSLVDVRLTAEASREHYKNNVDSFVLVSSDSDYYALIEAMPDARFLVVLEKEKSSFGLKEKLSGNQIRYCHMNDFYTGDDSELKIITILREMQRELEPLSFNVEEVFGRALAKARATMTEPEAENFRKKYIRPMHLKLDEDGNVTIEFGK